MARFLRFISLYFNAIPLYWKQSKDVFHYHVTLSSNTQEFIEDAQKSFRSLVNKLEKKYAAQKIVD